MDVSDLTVVRATEAQAAQAGVNCFQHWLVPRGFTSMAQLEWFGGQLHDDSYPWTAGAASWVLVPRSDPTTLDFLAACDTYGRVGVVCTPEGKREEVTSYAIASVFTPDKFRKKGYATHLLRLMHYVVADRSRLPPFPASWGAPPEEAFGDGVFSVLYSDVGDAFYANCTQGENKAGWVAPHDRAPHRVWKLELDEADRQVPEHWTWLADEDLPRLEEEVSAYMASAVKALGDGRSTKVYIPPKDGWLWYEPLRERLFTLAADIPVSDKTVGVRFGSSPDSPFLTFTTRDLPGKRRRIIIDFMFKPEQIPFSAVRTIAAKMDAPDIKLWGDHSAWDTAVPDQPRKLDQNLVPALAQYGLVEDDKDVHWLWCMHYAFC